MILALVISLIFVHGPQGQEIEINVSRISSIREPREEVGSHFAKGTKCVILMDNGKFIATMEPCEKIIELIREARK